MDFTDEMFGIKFKAADGMLEEKFDRLNFDDDNARYVSKEKFTHEEDDLSFGYRYVIDAEMTCEDGMVHREYSLKLVVEPSSLCADKLERVVSCSGIAAEEATVSDLVDYVTGYVVMGSKSTECEETLDDGWDMDMFNYMANVFESIDNTKKTYLDAVANVMGNTGWDLLDEAVNGADLLDLALKKQGIDWEPER